jgi:hypothetical protein
MRYITHQFAHVETLERTVRWLLQAGFDPSRIEANRQGIPRIALAVGPGESAEVELIIDAAESTDPDGNPSFWDLARQKHIYVECGNTEKPTPEYQPNSFVVGWRPVDTRREISQASTDADLREAYVKQHGD